MQSLAEFAEGAVINKVYYDRDRAMVFVFADGRVCRFRAEDNSLKVRGRSNEGELIMDQAFL